MSKVDHIATGQRYQPTYEELKRLDTLNIVGAQVVTSLPMRN